MNIDFVVPFVDCSDPVWQEQHKPYENVNGGNSGEWNSLYRYRSMGTLKYVFRGVEENMPWIRNIYLILSGPSQIPDWLDTSNPRLKIVYHKDYIPEEFLPCFNANTIECFLWRIEGLSEHFIYANDDIIPLNPMTEFDFFPKGNGKTRKIACNVYYVENVNPQKEDWRKMWQNCLKFGSVKKRVSATKTTYIRTDHGLSPLRKSSMKKLFSLWGDELLKTFTKVRDPKNVTQYMFLAYEDDVENLCKSRLKTGVDFKMKSQYNDVEFFKYIKNFDVCCVFDKHVVDFQEKIDNLTEYFETKYPFRCSFEKKDSEDKKVSIIVPMHNGEPFIKSLIENIKEQTYKNFECIVIDNGSTDSGADVVRDATKSDDRFKLFVVDWSGVSKARNFGIEKATGDYICFSDVDDVNESRRLECCVNYLNRNTERNLCQTFIQKNQLNGKSFLYCNMNYDYSIDSVFEKYCDPMLNSIMFRKEFLKDIRFAEVQLWEDSLFILDVIAKEKILPTLNYIGYRYIEREHSLLTSVFKDGRFPIETQRAYIRCIFDTLTKYKNSDASVKRLVKRLVFRNVSRLKFSKELSNDLNLLKLSTKFY